MKEIKTIPGHQRRRTLSLGLLSGSALLILIASIFAYSGIGPVNPQSAGNSGTGSTSSGADTLSVPAIVTLAFLSFVITLSVYGLLREVFKRFSRSRALLTAPTD